MVKRTMILAFAWIVMLPLWAAEARQTGENSRYLSQVELGRSVWFTGAGELTALGGSLLGGAMSAGYQMGFIGFELKGRIGKTSYGAIQTKPDEESYYYGVAIDDPASELNRPREKGDSWSYWLFQPGVVVRSKTLPFLPDRLGLGGRFGVAFGRFSDLANALTLNAVLFATGAWVEYQFTLNSPLSLEMGVDMTFGTLGSTQLQLLPVQWLSLNAGVTYWF